MDRPIGCKCSVPFFNLHDVWVNHVWSILKAWKYMLGRVLQCNTRTHPSHRESTQLMKISLLIHHWWDNVLGCPTLPWTPVYPVHVIFSLYLWLTISVPENPCTWKSLYLKLYLEQLQPVSELMRRQTNNAG